MPLLPTTQHALPDNNRQYPIAHGHTHCNTNTLQHTLQYPLQHTHTATHTATHTHCNFQQCLGAHGLPQSVCVVACVLQSVLQNMALVPMGSHRVGRRPTTCAVIALNAHFLREGGCVAVCVAVCCIECPFYTRGFAEGSLREFRALNALSEPSCRKSVQNI